MSASPTDTGRILVLTPTDALGMSVARVVTERIAADAGKAPVYVVPPNDVLRAILASGYSPSPFLLEQSDIRALAKMFRADLVIGVKVTSRAEAILFEAGYELRSGYEFHNFAAGSGPARVIGDRIIIALQSDSVYRRLRGR